MLLLPSGALRALHALPNNDLLLLRHSGLLTRGWHTAFPSLAPQATRAAQKKAVVSIPPLPACGRGFSTSTGAGEAAAPSQQTSVRESPSDLGARSDIEAFPSPSGRLNRRHPSLTSSVCLLSRWRRRTHSVPSLTRPRTARGRGVPSPPLYRVGL